MRCRSCGLLSTWPLPSAQVLQSLYDDPAYFDERTVRDRGAWANRAREVISMLPELPESVLDFGAGEGDLVRALRDAGISAHGIESSQTARATALRSQGVELFARLDEEVHYPPKH